MPQALTEYDIKMGKKIRDYRIILDYSQQELADYLKLTKQAISRIENGKRRITAQELEKIASFFDVPVAFFLTDDYKYTNLSDTNYDIILPVFMASFIDHYEKALTVDAGKNNLADKYTKKFINLINHVNGYVIGQLKTNEVKFRKYIAEKEKYIRGIYK
jgi:transcriptional regulator with XRE-family HTH domain